jgi:formylglycine-generating enzyme required for sulfatase activity
MSAEQALKRVISPAGNKVKGKQETRDNGSRQGEINFIFHAPTTVQVQTTADTETEAWRAALSADTAAAYKTYLDAYPNGRFVLAARIRLTAADKPQQTAPPQAANLTEDPETRIWNEAKSTGAREQFESYLGQYPKGKYAVLVKGELAKLDERDRKQRRQQEAERQRLAAEQKQREAAELEKAEAMRREQEAARLAAERKKAEAELRPGKRFKDCSDCPEMVVIPEGSFEMGSESGESREKPVHRVTIPRFFALGKAEVTQAQWRAVTGVNPSHFSRCGDDCPVEKVSWDDAQEFVRKLSQKTGKPYRLPSEAEWEYACRAGGQHEYCGSDNSDSVARYLNNSGRTTHAVASKQANAFGLHDMSGNVWEWVEDCWQNSYNGAPADGSPWISGDCVMRVMRGGSWNYLQKFVRSANRNWDVVSDKNYFLGLRVARTLP